MPFFSQPHASLYLLQLSPRSFEFINGGAKEQGGAVPGSLWLNSFTGERHATPDRQIDRSHLATAATDAFTRHKNTHPSIAPPGGTSYGEQLLTPTAFQPQLAGAGPISSEYHTYTIDWQVRARALFLLKRPASSTSATV